MASDELLTQLGHAVTSFHGTMIETNTLLSNPKLNEAVPNYNGEEGSCREWIEALEKHAEINRLNSQKRISNAYSMCRGLVSDFVRRWQEENPGSTWEVLKQQLILHFSEITDSEHAHDLLRKIRQGPNEKISHFSGRLHKMSRDAYPAADLVEEGAQKLAQKQLVNYFIDGLSSKDIKMKIMRAKPVNLKAATDLARDEGNLRTRFELRTNRPYRDTGLHDTERSVEPMEVDLVRPRGCRLCRRTTGHERNCPRRKTQVNEVYNTRQCYTCRSTQHLARDCPEKQDNSGCCFFCNSQDHWIRDCPERPRGSGRPRPEYRDDRPNNGNYIRRNKSQQASSGNARGLAPRRK